MAKKALCTYSGQSAVLQEDIFSPSLKSNLSKITEDN